MDHAAQDPGGVLDRFAPAQLRLAGAEKDDLAAQFADADFKGDARAGGGFGKDQGPALAGQRLRGVPAALGASWPRWRPGCVAYPSRDIFSRLNRFFIG